MITFDMLPCNIPVNIKERDFTTVIHDLKLYLQNVLHVLVKLRPCLGHGALPFLLTDLYAFYEMTLFEQVYLLTVAKTEVEITSAEVQKHWKLLGKKWFGSCIYVRKAISSHNRASLIKGRIPFIVPRNQMYLPNLGIDLKEHFKKIKNITKDFLSPATQAVVIYALLRDQNKKHFSVELSRELGYTVMTMNRAFDGLKAAAIGEVHWQGKKRYWTFSGTKKELWEQTKGMMRSPVKNRIWLRRVSALKKTEIFSGLSALSHYSKLKPPSLPVYALGSIDLKNLKLAKAEILPFYKADAVELEVWQYNPRLFQQESHVDPFSLYLSLQESTDERIESALEEMLETI